MWRPDTNETRESFAIVRKGYDREAVDRLLSGLRQELTQAAERIAKLEVELSQARQAHETLREDTRLALSDPERASKLLGQEASEVLKSANDAALGLRRKAESTAKDLVERARREAEEITRQAKAAAETEIEEGRQVARSHLEEVRQQGREILAMADSTASSTVEAAKREGRSLVFRAREHAAKLTQQAENRAAQVREEISGLDLERQRLIGVLRSAQDLVRSSLASLDTRPLFPEHVIPTSEDDSNATSAHEEQEKVEAKTGDQSAIQPIDENGTDEVVPSAIEINTTPEVADIDASPSEMTLADVTRLIELAAEQTAAFELDDAEDYLANDGVDHRTGDRAADSVESNNDTDPPSTYDSRIVHERDDFEIVTQEANLDASEPEEIFTASDDSSTGDLAESGDPTRNASTAFEVNIGPPEAAGPSVARFGGGADSAVSQQPMEFEDEIVVIERYRQPRVEAAQNENSKSRLRRLEALFSELREEDVAPEAIPNPDNGQPSLAPTDATPFEATSTANFSGESVSEGDHNPYDRANDQLAQRIRGALKNLFDPRMVDLSRRVKRITQDDLNKILATLRSNGREAAISLIDQMVNESQMRAGDVRLLVARILHAGSDFGALLGDQQFDPSGQYFEEMAQEMAIDLTDTLGEATLLRALDVLERSPELDETELVARTNGIYREARRKLDELISDSAYQTFCRGVRLVPGATGYLWVTSSTTQPCADCEDNVLAGINPVAEAFPTGHENPPAHPGCTCVIVPVFA
ncbi:hypothetical protein [Ferrimicrobium sp.]|uniref:hypothetical protein n=1 Tax=Ferrimicrobium sp. TaxID=2926050 RepID=UPI00260C1ACD|nr:hypothetical protein [Ferrimicrobium sp.]